MMAGNQKCMGNIPTFKNIGIRSRSAIWVIAVVNVNEDERLKRSVINNMIDPLAWTKKYLIMASVFIWS